MPAPIINGGGDSLWKWPNFRLSRARDLYLGSGHTAYRHASLIDFYLHSECYWNRRNVLWTDGRTFETHFIRSTRRSRPKKREKNLTIIHYNLSSVHNDVIFSKHSPQIVLRINVQVVRTYVGNCKDITFSESAAGLQSPKQCWMTSPANISVPQLQPRHCIHVFRVWYAAQRSDLYKTNKFPYSNLPHCSLSWHASPQITPLHEQPGFWSKLLPLLFTKSYTLSLGKSKGFAYSLPSVGPGAIPMYRQSTHRWL